MGGDFLAKTFQIESRVGLGKDRPNADVNETFRFRIGCCAQHTGTGTKRETLSPREREREREDEKVSSLLLRWKARKQILGSISSKNFLG